MSVSSALYHRDMGNNGSEFVYMHRPLRSGTLFTVFLIFLLILAFSLKLHQLDENILSGICIVLMIGLFIKLYQKVKSESLLILPALGIQVEIRYFLGRVRRHRIDMLQLKDIIINEAVFMHAVLYYLVVLVREHPGQEASHMHPLFTHSWPKLEDLRQVYCTAQEKLGLNKKPV